MENGISFVLIIPAGGEDVKEQVANKQLGAILKVLTMKHDLCSCLLGKFEVEGTCPITHHRVRFTVSAPR